VPRIPPPSVLTPHLGIFRCSRFCNGTQARHSGVKNGPSAYLARGVPMWHQGAGKWRCHLMATNLRAQVPAFAALLRIWVMAQFGFNRDSAVTVHPPSPSPSPHSVCPLRPLNLHCPGMLQASHVTYFFERLRCPGLLHVPSCAICQHLSRVIIRSMLCVQASMYGVFNAVLLRGLTATAVASFAASDMPTFPDVSP
jgi:hypothetical protein